MKAEEVMEILTDGTYDQWHEIAQRVERLNAMLLQEQIKSAGLVGELDRTREDHQCERDGWRADFDRLAREVRETAEAHLCDRNRLALLAQHLPEIVADWLSSISLIRDEALTDEYRLKRQHATELLRLLEPFAP